MQYCERWRQNKQSTWKGDFNMFWTKTDAHRWVERPVSKTDAHRWVKRPVSKTDAHRGAQGLHIPNEWFSNRRSSGAQKSWSTKWMEFSVLLLSRVPQRARGNVFWHAPDFSTDTHQVAIRRLNEMAHRNGKSSALLKVPW